MQEELLLAKQSRLEGNEGRARVCARRAAGAAAKAYFQGKDSLAKEENTIQSLVRLGIQDLIPDRVKLAVNWLVMRVNEDYALPANVDLIHEAGVVISFLEEFD